MADIRIAVISDSHGDRSAFKHALKKMGHVDALFHLGDGAPDARLAQDMEIPTYVVRGNCDITSVLPAEGIAQMGKRRILYCHGHAYRVQFGVELLVERARGEYADIAMFGHTHIRFAQYQSGVWVFNPGSLSKSRSPGKNGFGILELTDTGICHTFIDLRFGVFG